MTYTPTSTTTKSPQKKKNERNPRNLSSFFGFFFPQKNAAVLRRTTSNRVPNNTHHRPPVLPPRRPSPPPNPYLEKNALPLSLSLCSLYYKSLPTEHSLPPTLRPLLTISLLLCARFFSPEPKITLKTLPHHVCLTINRRAAHDAVRQHHPDPTSAHFQTKGWKAAVKEASIPTTRHDAETARGLVIGLP